QGPQHRSVPSHTEIPGSTRPCLTCSRSTHARRPSILATHSRQSPAQPAPEIRPAQAASPASAATRENSFSPATLLINQGLHTIRRCRLFTKANPPQPAKNLRFGVDISLEVKHSLFRKFNSVNTAQTSGPFIEP